MKNLSARYRLQLVDRGLLGCEGVDECLPCIYKKKSGVLKRKQVCNTNLTMVLMLYFPHLYHSFITMLVFFFCWKNRGSFDQILFTWAHNGLHTQLGCRWLHKPKQLIEHINLSVNIYSQPISHMRMESLLKMFPLKMIISKCVLF